MARGAVGLLEALGAVLADPQQPPRKASPLFAANPVQPFANRYCDCCGHRLTRALGEFLNEAVGFRILDVKAHDWFLSTIYRKPIYLKPVARTITRDSTVVAETIGFAATPRCRFSPRLLWQPSKAHTGPPPFSSMTSTPAVTSLSRALRYFFRCGRGSKGFRTGTPVGSKSDTFRVTTVRPCSSAVAAIARSSCLLPNCAASRPHRRATPTVRGKMRSS